jgi:phenylacetate-CoA ligase
VEKIYKSLPNFLQNTLVTLYDWIQYRKRHGGRYIYWYNYFGQAKKSSREELLARQYRMLHEFIMFAIAEAPYYKKQFEPFIDRLTNSFSLDLYAQLPIQSKEAIRTNLESIYTVPAKAAILSKTGGTTGKSMQVRFTHDDMQNRFAMLDLFRAETGYKLGKKVAWFSGKSLVNSRDFKKNRYWKTDFLYNIRYYSTFHINHQTIQHYIDNLNAYKPLFAVGFPSSMVEIAKWGLANNYLLSYKMVSIFPTAETVTDYERDLLQQFFGGKVLNQYASSEGAPFIIECAHGNLHAELLSGYFEVLDENNRPANEGRLVFTSFTTHGTPLIRYDINDRLRLSDRKCTCGNNNPLVDEIQGRINDFVYSPQNGKINLGNVSNCVKYVKGIIKFQIIQDIETAITVKIQKDTSFTPKDEKMFLHELRERLGEEMVINFEYVSDISTEASGKFRLVKQSLKF